MQRSRDHVTLNVPLSLPMAAELYREETKSPYHFRRIASVATVHSTYVSHESSSESPGDDMLTSEFQALANVHMESMKKPSYFNVLVVGDSGLGKSSFIDALLRLKFNCGLVQDLFKEPVHSAVRPPTKDIKHHSASKTEGGFEVKIDLIDTPGYGTYPCFEEWLRTITDFISEQNFSYVQEKAKNRSLPDTRIHMCFFFLEGPRVKHSDLTAMFTLQHLVNLVPILAKADAFTPLEILQVKLEIAQQCADAEIQLFDCAKYMGSDIRLLSDSPLGPCPPFAVISSVDFLELSPGKYTYGRVYPWGVCDISNSSHSDFNLMYNVVIGYLMQPAIDNTKLLVKKQLRNRAKSTVSNRKSIESKLVEVAATVLGVVTLGVMLAKYRMLSS